MNHIYNRFNISVQVLKRCPLDILFIKLLWSKWLCVYCKWCYISNSITHTENNCGADDWWHYNVVIFWLIRWFFSKIISFCYSQNVYCSAGNENVYGTWFECVCVFVCAFNVWYNMETIKWKSSAFLMLVRFIRWICRCQRQLFELHVCG